MSSVPLYNAGEPPALVAARSDFAALELTPLRREALGLFLRLLARGERTANVCARAQAAHASENRDRRFLLGQARQEAIHALLFETSASWLGAPPLAFVDDPYAAFEAQVAAAAQAGRQVETVVAVQGILEALGAMLLSHLDAGIEQHGSGFRHLRRTLLRQEAAHHAFGAERIARWQADGTLTVGKQAEIAAPYVALADRMIVSGDQALTHFGLTAAQLQRELRASAGFA